jgi:hypothetical protein
MAALVGPAVAIQRPSGLNEAALTVPKWPTSEVRRAELRTRLKVVESIAKSPQLAGLSELDDPEEELRQIEKEANELTEREARLLAPKEENAEVPSPSRIRSIFASSSLVEKRELVARVIEKIVVHPQPEDDDLHVEDRLEIFFRPGYAPPQDELTAVLTTLRNRRLEATSACIQRATRGVSPEIDERIWTRHQQGGRALEIARELERDGVPTPRGAKTWVQTVRNRLRHLAAAHGEPYRLEGNAKLPPETLALIARKADEGYTIAAIVRYLVRNGIPTLRNGRWSHLTVRRALAQARGEVMVLEGTRVDAAAQEYMRDLKAQGLSIRAVCDRLDASPHRPPKGEKWSPTTVHRTLSLGISTL